MAKKQTSQKRKTQAVNAPATSGPPKEAGLSKAELKAKLQRLALMVERGNLKLVAEMIINFEDAWLFESLLAGTSINEKNRLVPGKVLKRFKDHSAAVGLLALAHAPAGTALDPSLTKSTPIDVTLTGENFEFFVEHISPHFPKLKHEGNLDLAGLTTLSDAAAEALAKLLGERFENGFTEVAFQKAVSV